MIVRSKPKQGFSLFSVFWKCRFIKLKALIFITSTHGKKIFFNPSNAKTNVLLVAHFLDDVNKKINWGPCLVYFTTVYWVGLFELNMAICNWRFQHALYKIFMVWFSNNHKCIIWSLNINLFFLNWWYER